MKQFGTVVAQLQTHLTALFHQGWIWWDSRATILVSTWSKMIDVTFRMFEVRPKIVARLTPDPFPAPLEHCIKNSSHPSHSLFRNMLSILLNNYFQNNARGTTFLKPFVWVSLSTMSRVAEFQATQTFFAHLSCAHRTTTICTFCSFVFLVQKMSSTDDKLLSENLSSPEESVNEPYALPLDFDVSIPVLPSRVSSG